MNTVTEPRRVILIVATIAWMLPVTLWAQEQKQDPASDSNVITETLSKIKDVENLEKYKSENATLKQTNQQLTQEIARLTQEIAKINQQLQTQKELLTKQLLNLPKFEVKSKLVGANRSLAVLKFGEKSIRIRNGVEMSVPVGDGSVWTLMKVEKITNELIEIFFPELDRKITLYD